jgi:hypothetical protein
VAALPTHVGLAVSYRCDPHSNTAG